MWLLYNCVFWRCLWCIVRGGLISRLIQQQAPAWRPLHFSCNWSPPPDILVKASSASNWEYPVIVCFVLFAIVLSRELIWIPGWQIASNTEAKQCFFFVNYETNMSIISEKCIDIMACVHNYFWPWQCAMTAFLRLLFLQLFPFLANLFPHSLLFSPLSMLHH